MTAAASFTDEQANLFKQLCKYINILGAPVLPLWGIENGVCLCRKPDCKSNSGKHPNGALCPRGVKDATLDKEVVAGWIKRAPLSNWGVATGHPLPTGGFLLVLDVDPRNGGELSLDAGQTEHGNIPATPLQHTGGLGFHYLLRANAIPGGKVLAPGLDLKGASGYICVAPSIHHTGRDYHWDKKFDIDNTMVSDAPHWIQAGETPKPRPAWTGATAKDSVIGAGFEAAGWLGVELSEGRYAVHCPWSKQHTDGRGRGGDSSTVILPPTVESRSGGFHCRHEHCKGKSWQEAMEALPVDAAKAARRKFHAVGPIVADKTTHIDLVARVNGGLLPEEMQDLREHLTYSTRKDGSQVLKKDLTNIVSILKYDPRWWGVLTYDNFSHTAQVTKEPMWFEGDARGGVDAVSYPRGWTDSDDVRTILWFERFWGMQFEPTSVSRGVLAVCESQASHPVRKYLRAIEWDGVDRVDTWLSAYCGASDTPYTRAVGRWWLISAIARIMQPGAKADHVLILEGAQGIGKSTTFAILGGQWVCDSAINLGDKDAYQTIKGKWIVELAELDSLNRADSARAKAFFTSPTDTYRPSYGKHTITVPRQCVFAGTVNHGQFLRDETGNRRYWPVSCGRFATDRLKADRDQLWAEAVCLFDTGVRWWPVTPEDHAMCKTEQAQREFVDEWLGVIAAYVNGTDGRVLMNTKGHITVADVMQHAIKMEAGRWTQSDMLRVGRCLQQLHMIKFRPEGEKFWAYRNGEGE